MRFRSSVARAVALAALACCALCLPPLQVVRAQADETGLSDSEIATAVDKLKADPNLRQERKTRTLKWSGEDKPREPSSFGRWITNFFIWLGQLSRVLVWVVGGLLAIALLAFLYRLVRSIETREIKRTDLVPTHVRDLDIRPESLPDDIGAAALSLWQQGEHRAALALLYRGLLSRLAHVHEVPIRDSTTEGDCLALAAKHLPPERKDFVARLIRTWQRATYGGRDAQAEEVQALCADFAQALAGSNAAGQRP